MNLLQTFAVAEGWTLNIYDAGDSWMALNNGSVYVQFRWDGSTGIAMFHSTAFDGTGVAPGNHTGDDGCATVDASAPYNATVSTGRRINVGNGPYTAYHFFTDGTTKYIHVVLEYSPGLYRHFSFGTIDKIGDWTGGQYAVCTFWNQSSTNPSNTVSNQHSFLWDGLCGVSGISVRENGTIRVEGMPNQTGSMKWMMFGTATTSLGNDRAGNARITGLGGCRGANPYLTAFGPFRASLLTGFTPLIPIPIFWRDTSPAPDLYMLLGYAPGVRHIQMANYTAGQEITLGSDTWMIFPMIRKQNISSGEESKNAGMAYLKVT